MVCTPLSDAADSERAARFLNAANVHKEQAEENDQNEAESRIKLLTDTHCKSPPLPLKINGAFSRKSYNRERYAQLLP